MKESLKGRLLKINSNCYELPALGEMNVPARIFVSPSLLKNVDDSCLQQLANAARLPGIVQQAIGMSDVHIGYGLPIGGVIAFDTKKGVISPEAVGYDINCGVRLLRTNIHVKQFEKIKEQVIDKLFRTIPSGNGHEKYTDLSIKDIDAILEQGLSWAYKNKYATRADVLFSEDNGKIKGADASLVPHAAKERGRIQVGTLGAGNHFIEIQRVEKLFNKKVAAAFGLKQDEVCIMIHSGSRGLGHEVASHYIARMRTHSKEQMLAAAPISSAIGKDYLKAMAAAANFAFVNRQLMTYAIRQVFASFFGDASVELVYDLTHNIAKMEQLRIGGVRKKVCVHRKGATRSFGPGRKEISHAYRALGSPIFLPGSMGTASFALVGTHKAEELSLASAPHGAGRVLSRSAALQNYTPATVRKFLEKKGVALRARSEKGIPEEAPQAYKDVSEVARVTDELGIAKLVAKMTPLAVIKG